MEIHTAEKENKCFQIYSSDRELSLTVVKEEKDILIILELMKKFKITTPFSQLCSISFSRPWEFKQQEFYEVSCEKKGLFIQLQGKSLLFEVILDITFINDLLKINSRWKYIAPAPKENISIALVQSLNYNISTEKITMPLILYNDNPSSDPNYTVPHFPKTSNACLICEETRFPIPAVNVEWVENGNPISYTVFSIPDNKENDWSLGCERKEEKLLVICASGIVAFNGKKDMIYGKQRAALPFEKGYRTLRYGEVLQKEIIISLKSHNQYGHGFRDIVVKGFDIFDPKTTPVLSLDKVIELKTNALKNRYTCNDKSAGYICVLPGSIYPRPPFYLFGWTGQSLRLAWCSALLGIKQHNMELLQQSQNVVNFYVENSLCNEKGLRYSKYLLNEDVWEGAEEEGEFISSRAFGEALTNLGKIIELFQINNLDFPEKWCEELLKSANFLLDEKVLIKKEGIFPVYWTKEGSPTSDFISAAGLPCIIVLLKAYNISNKPCYLESAKSLLNKYWKISGDKFDRPFARSTLDARCEDKEAGIYFFLASYELFLLTNEEVYKEWTEIVADWILTYVYHWHTGFRKDTICAKNNFITTGWPAVSVQNHHLDVFFPAYELFDFGRRINNYRYKKMGKLIFEAWSHGICRYPGDWEHKIPGEQGEQFFQTNYFQGPFNENYWRGGYNPWNPSWIIALVLEAALKFKYYA